MRTAMQELIDNLREARSGNPFIQTTTNLIIECAEELLEKEKQQIIDANQAGRRSGYNGIPDDMRNAEKYYNETFNQ